MWEIIRGDGLMDWLAAGHLVLAILLLVPRTRFAAGFAQLPITVGIVAFNVTMFPSGVPLALGMLPSTSASSCALPTFVASWWTRRTAAEEVSKTER